MRGFGACTFRFVSAKGDRIFVQRHWTPKMGQHSLVWDEAVKSNSATPDRHRRNMWAAIDRGDFPELDLSVQLFDQAFADSFAFDVRDPAQQIPEEECPIKIIATLTLNRAVDNFFAETEQVAFCTGNVILSIDLTDDPRLQGRNFSCRDTRVKRLGSPNFGQMPVNAPRVAQSAIASKTAICRQPPLRDRVNCGLG